MEVKNFPNYIIHKDGRIINQTGKEMKKVLGNHGYYKYCLTNEKKQFDLSLHRLLAIHFIPNPENKPLVDHIDRNKLNNDLSNLRWSTHLKNQQNRGKAKNNKSGHKNIAFRKNRMSWEYNYRVMGKTIYRRTFKNKIDCLCYKFICLLRKK